MDRNGAVCLGDRGAAAGSQLRCLFRRSRDRRWIAGSRDRGTDRGAASSRLTGHSRASPPPSPPPAIPPRSARCGAASIAGCGCTERLDLAAGDTVCPPRGTQSEGTQSDQRGVPPPPPPTTVQHVPRPPLCPGFRTVPPGPADLYCAAAGPCGVYLRPALTVPPPALAAPWPARAAMRPVPRPALSAQLRRGAPAPWRRHCDPAEDAGARASACGREPG